MLKAAKLYSAYGTNISSPLPLVDLRPGSAPADISIQMGTIGRELLSAKFGNAQALEFPGVKILVSRRTMCFDWARLGRILVSDGRDVIVEPDPGTLEEDLQPFLLGPVMAVLLHQRGYFVLHASAVELNGTTVAFLGGRGHGKSTLAAYFQAKGHRLLSDDVVPVRFTNGVAETLPGFPRIKLFEDSINALGKSPRDFPHVHRFVEKRSLQFDGAFSSRPRSLQEIYVLAEGGAVGIKKIDPKAAFLEVLKNTHLNRFLEPLESQAEYFRHCERLVRSVRAFRLERPFDYSQMDEIVRLLEKNTVRSHTSESRWFAA
jgi:hypothetical protein